MDLDTFAAAHRAEWDRLAELVRRGRSLRGPDIDELVTLYQRTATHLSVLRATAPDPALLTELSSLVARARGVIAGTHSPALREVGLFFARRFPAAVYLSRWWWLSTTAVSVLLATVMAAWIARDPQVQASIAAPDEIRELAAPGGEFETYYSSNPASSFALQVWTNNAWVAAMCLFLGVLVGIPVIFALWTNILNIAVAAGIMASAGRLDVFLGLITPHGLLELTAVFIAAGTGLKLGWTVIDPGRRSRGAALAEQGRTVVAMALGLGCVLLISGVIEAFVTPSGLPTAARIAIGAAAEIAFLAYVFIFGRRAANAGYTGDIDATFAGDARPESG